MSACYECSECGLVVECDGCYAPAFPGDSPGPIDCYMQGCDGIMYYSCEGRFDGNGVLIEADIAEAIRESEEADAAGREQQDIMHGQ